MKLNKTTRLLLFTAGAVALTSCAILPKEDPNNPCNDDKLTTSEGQQECIMQTYAQAYKATIEFHNDLNITPQNLMYKRQEWLQNTKDVENGSQDYASIMGYGRVCSQLQAGMSNPEQFIEFGIGTITDLPRHCTEKPLELIEKYDITANKEPLEAAAQQVRKMETSLKRAGLIMPKQ